MSALNSKTRRQPADNASDGCACDRGGTAMAAAGRKSPTDLTQMSLEDLMNVQVVSVSK